MIDAQFEALSFADLDAAHKFVSPKVVEQYSMDVARFKQILRGPAYDGLIGCSSWSVRTISEPAADVRVVSLRVVPKPIPGCVRTSGMADQGGITWPTFYKWTLGRPSDGPMAGCWLLENMSPETPPIDVGATDGTPLVSVAQAQAQQQRATAAARTSPVSMKAAAWSPPATVDVAKTRLYGTMGEWNQLSMQEAAFANEMIQSTQFALIAPNWQYSRVYALGFETLCATFLTGSSRADVVRAGLCTAFDWDSEVLKADAAAMRALEGKTEEELFESEDFKAIKAANDKLERGLKYTYSLGAGLVVLMQQCGLEPEKAIPLWCEKLGLNCVNALSRDYAYYKTQVSKMESMLEMFEQMKASSEKAAAARKEELANEASD